MPIDFNPHFFNNPNSNPQQNISVQKSSLLSCNILDVFTKNTKVNNQVAASDFEGIKISQKPFGKIQKTGEEAILYTITNKNGASVNLSSYGATITGIKVPDKNGKLTDVTHGYNDVSPYETSPVGHAGGTIGPCANKIYKGEFSINGETYKLECNKDGGKTHSHGASDGFDIKNWNGKILSDGIEFTYLKKDMEGGHPGNVEAKVTYKFDNENRLHIIYEAKTDKDTLLNLTNHTYFNLDGAQNTSENAILDHIVTLPNSSKITLNNEIAVPTGEFAQTKGTPFDFSKPTKIADVINQDSEQLKIGAGFDQNYCIDGYDSKKLIQIAKVKSEKTGIELQVSTNLPGFQFYTSNHLGKSSQPMGKDGTRYEKRSGLCIEPQFYPNAINTESFTEKGILKKGETLNREIVYSFSTVKD